MSGMNKEWKSRWLAALRSDEFSQGQGCLRGNSGYCCLGVLVEVARRVDPLIGEWRVDDEGRGYVFTKPGQLSEAMILPENIAYLVGLDDADPSVPIHNRDTSLSSMNDNGWSFGRIADAIEEHL